MYKNALSLESIPHFACALWVCSMSVCSTAGGFNKGVCSEFATQIPKPNQIEVGKDKARRVAHKLLSLDPTNSVNILCHWLVGRYAENIFLADEYDRNMLY